MKVPSSIPLTAHEVRRLLRNPGGCRDEATSGRLMCDAFHLSDNSLLLVFADGRGRRYESRDDVLAHAAWAAAQPGGSFRIVERLLPNRQSFIARLPQLLGALPECVGLDAEAFDFTDESLRQLDDALRRLGVDAVLTPHVFEPLTAYIGEVIRRRTGAHWEMVRDQDGVVGPWLADRVANRYHAPFMFAADLYESGSAASVAAFVDAIGLPALPTHPEDDVRH
jgi:hypothetical protein